MILIGQFDSPFVRRVGVALELLGLPYEHRAWSVFGDAEQIASINPLIRVPTLVLDDGEVLTETFVILDAIDQMVGPDRALTPDGGIARRRSMMISALSAGVCDKAVSMLYEQRIHQRATDAWVQRCVRQVSGGLDQLEKLRASEAAPWFAGDRLGAADIAVGAMWRFVSETQGARFDLASWPALGRHGEACEALPVFRKIQQPHIFTPPKS